jgi:hypothetical protein
MLSEVSQAQKDKGHMFSLTHRRQMQKINIYTNTNSYVEHVCNSGTTLWNPGKEVKERMIEHQQYHKT